MGVPVLKKSILAVTVVGPVPAWNLKLYKVPQRNAFAFGFWAKVSVCQLTTLGPVDGVQGALL